jgi:polyhydroxyalkanoate synthesis regulator phasin
MRLALASTTAVKQIDQATSDLQREDVTALPTAALGEDLVALRRQVDRLEAELRRRSMRLTGP